MSHTGKVLYRRADVQRLLSALRDGLVSEFKPRFSCVEGFTYPDAERVMGASQQVAKQTLESLVEDGLLVKELSEVMVACPFCGSVGLSIRLECPNCGLSTVRRGVAIEHLPCGHLDFEDIFTDAKGLVCPKCRKPLKALGIDYRKPGSFYRCSSCREMTASPKKTLICGGCGKAFSEDDAAVAEAYIYRVNPEKTSVIAMESMDLRPIIEKLRDMGWEARPSASLKGKSGIEHQFFLVVNGGNEGRRLAVDITMGEGVVDEVQILSFYAKALDAGVWQSILVAVPGVTDKARRLAEFYNIILVEATSHSQVVELLGERLQYIVEMWTTEALKREAESLETLLKELKQRDNR